MHRALDEKWSSSQTQTIVNSRFMVKNHYTPYFMGLAANLPYYQTLNTDLSTIGLSEERYRSKRPAFAKRRGIMFNQDSARPQRSINRTQPVKINGPCFRPIETRLSMRTPYCNNLILSTIFYQVYIIVFSIEIFINFSSFLFRSFCNQPGQNCFAILIFIKGRKLSYGRKLFQNVHQT